VFRKLYRRRRRIPVIRQLTHTDCGPAVLAMILAYYGKETPISELRDQCSAGRDGINGRDFITIAAKYGLNGRAYSLEPADLQQLPFPLILHWNFRHFVILERWGSRQITIVDPAAGRRIITLEELDTAFTGIALSLEPCEGFECTKSENKSNLKLKYLRALLSEQHSRSGLIQVMVASLLLQLSALVVPLFTKIILDAVIPQQLPNIVLVLAGGICILVLAESVIKYLRDFVLIHLRLHLDRAFMTSFIDHVLRLSFTFFQSRAGGDILMRVNSNRAVREIVTTRLLSIVFDSLFVVSLFVVLMAHNVLFGVIIAAATLVQALIFGGTRDRVRNLVNNELISSAAEQSYAIEALTGISTIKASGAEDNVFHNWQALLSTSLLWSSRQKGISSMLQAISGFITRVVPILLLWFGIYRVLAGGLTIGDWLALNLLAMSVLSPIGGLLENLHQVKIIEAHLERVYDVLDTPPEPQGSTEDISLTGDIIVRNLCFRHGPTSKFILRDISFSIKPGQTIAIVGQTGSGKSTLLMLLLGLYNPTSGEIRYDGVPVSCLKLSLIRRQFGVVLQEPFLFTGSVRDNIALNEPGLSLTKMHNAARLSCIHDQITKMPLQYETFLVEGAIAISGGERQRLAIARAVARDPHILFFDEATSNLDSQTELEIYKNLQKLKCTKILIAHRLSTVQHADQILVLRDGLIAESGTHESLIRLEGHYLELVRAQTVSSIGATAVARPVSVENCD
jgi:ATP-binding cassette subfamily B protein